MQISELAGGMTRLDIPAPNTVKWRPGQHFFLRIPGLDLLGNHPFTSASAFTVSYDTAGKSCVSSPQNATFYIRSHSGFTKALATHAQSQSKATPSVLLEGPCGCIPYMIENTFDRIILVAGGGGVSTCLPWMEYLTSKRAAGIEMRASSVKFVWAVRSAEHLKWADESKGNIHKMMTEDCAFIEKFFYVTGDPRKSLAPQSDLEGAHSDAMSQLEGSELKTHQGKSRRNVSEVDTIYKRGRSRMMEVITSLIVDAGRTFVIGKMSSYFLLLEK